MATLATLRLSVATKIGLDNTTSGDQGQIDNWLNEGYERVLIDTHCKVRSTSVTPGASSDYTLSTSAASGGVLAIVDMYMTAGGTDSALEPRSVDQIIYMRRTGATATAPARYYALAGHDLLLFYPTPDASDVLTMYYVSRPAALSLSSDSPGDIPSEFHKAIEYYACAEGADYDDDQSSAQGQRYRELYDAEIRRFKKDLHKKAGYRLAPARVGRRERRPIQLLPSQDYR